MSAKEGSHFLSRNLGFGSFGPQDDFLHPQINARQPGDSTTETQYFGLSVPEHNIHGLLYCWHRPNLKLITGGVWVWQGIKPNHLACELFDMRSFMSDAPLAKDLHHFSLDNSYSVSVLEPLKRLRACYRDEDRGHAIDVEYTALADPVMFASGQHFDQGMRVKGTLKLAGTDYKVDSYTVRDRSWGALRPEEHFKLPPIAWVTGVFGEDFFFNCTAFDDPALGPDWQGLFELPSDRVCKGGWIHHRGVVTEVMECHKRTVRDPHTLIPQSVEMTLIDSAGESFEMRGTIIAASTWSAWLNCEVAICLARWECRGRVGHGDVQDAKWHDYIRARLGGRAEPERRSGGSRLMWI